MTDHKELVRRLREAAAVRANLGDTRRFPLHVSADAIEKLAAEVERLRETVARLQETLEAYGDGGNEGPSMHAFLGDYQLVKEAIGGSYTAESFEALTEKASRLADIERQVRERCVWICQYHVGRQHPHAPECMAVELFGESGQGGK